jgi:hypothetical protein
MIMLATALRAASGLRRVIRLRFFGAAFGGSSSTLHMDSRLLL